MNTSRTTDTTIGIEDGFIIELDKKNPKVKSANGEGPMDDPQGLNGRGREYAQQATPIARPTPAKKGGGQFA